MKKIIAILSMLLISSVTFLQAQGPVAGKKYYIRNNEVGLYLTIDPSQNLNVTKVDNFTGSENQIFEVVQDASNPEHFNLKVLNQYLKKSNIRTHQFPNFWFDFCDVLLNGDSTTDEAEFILTTVPAGYTFIQSLLFANTKKYLAPGIENPYESYPEIKPGTPCYIDTRDFYPGSNHIYAYLWAFEEITGKPEETLAIKTLNPGNQAIDAFEKTDVWVSFTKLLPDNIDLSGVTIKDNGGNAVSGVSATMSDSHSTITIRHNELVYGKTYTVTIPAGAIDGYGQSIEWSFTVRDLPNWQQDESVFFPAKGIFAGKKYKIKNVGTGDYLTIHPELENNVARVQGYVGSENQIFELFRDTSNPENFNIGVVGKYLKERSDVWWEVPVILGDNPAGDDAEFVLKTNDKGQTTIQSKRFACDQRYFTLDADQLSGAYPYGGVCYGDLYPSSEQALHSYQLWKLEELEETAVLKTNTFSPLKDEKMVSTRAKVSVSFTKPLPANTNLNNITIKDKDGNPLSGIRGTVSASRWSIAIEHADFQRGKTYTVTIPASSIPAYGQAIWWSFSTNDPVTYPSKGKYYIKNVGANAYLTANVTPDFFSPISVKAKNAKGANEYNVFDVLEGENGKILLRIENTEQLLAFIHPAWGWLCGISESTINDRTQFYLQEGSAKESVRLQNAFLSADKFLFAGGDKIVAADGKIPDKGTSVDWILEPLTTYISTDKINNVFVPSLSKGTLPITTGGQARVKVLDVSGRIQAAYQSNGNLTINMDYANGLYIVTVDNGNLSSHKVILQK